MGPDNNLTHKLIITRFEGSQPAKKQARPILLIIIYGCCSLPRNYFNVLSKPYNFQTYSFFPRFKMTIRKRALNTLHPVKCEARVNMECDQVFHDKL